MKPRPLHGIAAVVDGRSEGDADIVVTRVVTDSREAGPGSLFVALPGTRTHGARYVDDAFANGAAAAIVPAGGEGTSASPVVRVASTGDALLRLAADERRSMDATVVGITGANGKTSTKDLASAMIASHRRLHASPRSFNNEIGLPMTLLSAPEGTEVILAELGARHVGDVALLCEVARPQIAVVTNVGVAHMEAFGSWDAIVRAAAEPVEALDPDGTAILCVDDPVVRGIRPVDGVRVLTFGIDEAAEVRGEAIALDPEGRASFDLVYGGGRERVELAVPGEHMVSNALAAAASGIAIGLTPPECAAGIKGAHVSPWRMDVFVGAGGIRVVNDAYNANPESMAAAIRTARWIAADGALIAVLGPMAELGEISVREHERIGELVTRVRVDRLITVGADARTIATAAVREGLPPDDVADYDTIGEATADVRAHARPGDTVLCKASRVAGLERVAEALR